MIVYEYLRKIKGYYKIKQKEKAGLVLSPVRRIERVYPPNTGRYVAMTFDDGPSYLKTNPLCSSVGLTEHILSVLEKYNAHGTFDVIGTTKENYPDEKGADGKFEWSGKRYDHYPDFGMDQTGGAKNCPDLINKMIDGGHQITNHGYRHVLFGKKRLVYGNRHCFENVFEARDDIQKLDNLLKNDFDYKMTMARPPHYVDKTCDGYSSYDIYRYLNYQYMAASFDGGGWVASSGSYEQDVAKMIKPLEKALSADPDSLNGQIIFQKDGSNMSRMTPVANALEKQLDLLYKYGYNVVTVKELLSMSVCEDVPCDSEVFEPLRSLVCKGYTLLSKNNCFYGHRNATVYEFLTMISNPSELLSVYRDLFDNCFRGNEILLHYKVSAKHYLAAGICVCAGSGFISQNNTEKLCKKTPLTWDFLRKLDPAAKGKTPLPTKKDIVLSMAKILLK